ILGENGMVEISGFAVNQMKQWNFKNPLPSDKLAMSKYSENPPDVYGYGHKAYYKNVVDCILHDSNPLVDGNEALKSLKLIHALYKSIETKAEVRLNDLSHPIFTKLGQK
ncbi:Gfo/Idh/MocA family oxidoreductase, partial [Amylibacter sp.]|nr:Gfo/Idh/MocA family oxidoreductase [Amylibacter sp.]